MQNDMNKTSTITIFRQYDTLLESFKTLSAALEKNDIALAKEITIKLEQEHETFKHLLEENESL